MAKSWNDCFVLFVLYMCFESVCNYPLENTLDASFTLIEFVCLEQAMKFPRDESGVLILYVKVLSNKC